MPELLQQVAGRLVSVEEGLAALDNHKTALHNHTDMVKGEISSAVERQMSVLKAREKQLIRQVEVASTHLNSEVNVTQAQLLQHKGALSVTRTILDNCNSNALEAEECSGGDDNYSYSTMGVRCCDSNGNPPPALPRVGTDRACCRYNGGGDGRVSRASAAGGCGSTLSSTIATTVNSLPHQDLAGLLQHTEKLLRVPLVSVSLDEPSLSSTVQRWGRVSLPPSLSHSELLPRYVEEYGDAEHHVLHKSLAPVTPQVPIDVRRPYLLAARARQGLKAAQAASDADLLPRETTKPLAVPAGDKRKEDLVRWLHHLQLDEEDRFEDRPCRFLEDSLLQDELNVENACQANETCNNFSNCIMGGKCKQAALEKADQTARWQQQQTQSEDFNQSQLCVFKMDLTVNSRKRHLSESTGEPAKAVVSHMTNIRSSANGTWLMPAKPESLCDGLNQLNLDNKVCWSGKSFSGSSRASTPLPDVMDVNKKLKVNHFFNASPASVNTQPNTMRSAIMYQAPQVSWCLKSSSQIELVDKKDSSLEIDGLSSLLPDVASEDAARVPPIGQVLDASEVNTASSDTVTWLLPLATKEGTVLRVSTKKASNDKENNLCRASIIKSLTDVGSIENLKDKVDHFAGESDNKAPSDLELKESWLLQKCSSLKADNKILDEVMKQKSEWLSSSSLASFSVISDPDGFSNSWLLPSRVAQY